MLKTFLSIAAIALLSWAACACFQPRKDADQPPSCNFYYWKTTLDFGKADKALADSLGMKKLYLRFFDVDWSPVHNMPVPVASLMTEAANFEGNNWLYETNSYHLENYQAVPVVYLTNRVFEKDYHPDSLATKVAFKIQEQLSTVSSYVFPGWDDVLELAEAGFDERYELSDTIQKKFKERITEIQLDCDWTPATRERYFSFLESMKRANPGMDISCTVRLHQFRDREAAGIPPVKRGTLMCYNFTSPALWPVTDAIFDPELAAGYLKNGQYPLPLEAALPLFSWGALFHEDEFKGLAAGLSEGDVANNPLFKHLGKNRYQFTQDTVFQNVYMREGDAVRVDQASPEELKQLASRLGKIKAVESISFFEWDPSKIKSYHVTDIFAAFSAAR